MKLFKKSLLITGLLNIVAGNIHGMNEQKEVKVNVYQVGDVLLGQSYLNPGEHIVFTMMGLPAEVASKIAGYLFIYQSVENLIEMGKIINILARTNKELNELINDPYFSMQLIQYLQGKFNCSQLDVIKALQTQEAAKDLRPQWNQKRLYDLVYSIVSYQHQDTEKALSELSDLCKSEGINLNFMYSNTIFGDNFTLLMMAAIRHNKVLMNRLIYYGADINFANNKGHTVLMYVIQKDDIEAVKMVLSSPNININQQDKDGNTALMLAVKNEQSYRKVIAQMLLDAGADPEIADFKGVTPLEQAKDENIFGQNDKVIAILKQAIRKKYGK